MSRLARKMYHGSQNSLSLPFLHVNSPPIGQDTPPAREQHGKRAPVILYEQISYFRVA